MSFLKGIKNTVASAADQIGDVLEQAEHKAEESAKWVADSAKGAYDVTAEKTAEAAHVVGEKTTDTAHSIGGVLSGTKEVAGDAVESAKDQPPTLLRPLVISYSVQKRTPSMQPIK
ncbi:hypothetical protein COOONC_27978 [Cooperia oncophora]